MRMTTLVGVLLILVGVVGLLLGGMGPPQQETPVETPAAAQAAADGSKGLPMTAVLGGLTMACGVGLLIRGRRH